MSAKRSPWWSPRPRRRRWMRPKRSKSSTRNCRSCCIPKTRCGRARRRCGTKLPDNVTVDTEFGNAEATDRAFAQAAHVVTNSFHVGRVTGVPMEPRAALGSLRCRDRPLHALRRIGRRGAAKARAFDGARRSAGQLARAVARRRRQFRHAQSRLRRVRPGLVGVAKARPAGEIHRDALGGFSQRLSGPRSRHQGRTGARRQASLHRDARDQYQQCRRTLRLAVAAEQGRGAHSRLLCHSGNDAARGGGFHQHHADAGLSQLGPAGSDLRHRAPGRSGGRRTRRRSHHAAAQESRPPAGHAVPQFGRHALRQRHTTK